MVTKGSLSARERAIIRAVNFCCGGWGIFLVIGFLAAAHRTLLKGVDYSDIAFLIWLLAGWTFTTWQILLGKDGPWLRSALYFTLSAFAYAGVQLAEFSVLAGYFGVVRTEIIMNAIIFVIITAPLLVGCASRFWLVGRCIPRWPWGKLKNI